MAAAKTLLQEPTILLEWSVMREWSDQGPCDSQRWSSSVATASANRAV